MSDLTKLNWNEVFAMPAIEFLAYIQFHNYKAKKEEQKAREFYNRNKPRNNGRRR